MSQVTFDSKDNHQIISVENTGSYDESLPATTSNITHSIPHTLGYMPNIRVYFEPIADDIWPITPQLWADAGNEVFSSVHTTPTTIEFDYDNPSGPALDTPVYYRVYEDGDTTDDNVSFDSKERIEKILAVLEGSFTADAAAGPGFYTYTQEQLPNPTGSKQLSVLRWSLDGTTWVDGDVTQLFATGINPDYVSAIAHCDNNSVYIEVFNSYLSDLTIFYKVYLFQLDYDSKVLDTKKNTFLNFGNNEVSIEVSGAINNGQRLTWTASIGLNDEAFGNWYVSRSDVANTEYLYPYKSSDFLFTASNLILTTQIEYGATEATIVVSMINGSGVNRVIPATTITYRYALFRA